MQNENELEAGINKAETPMSPVPKQNYLIPISLVASAILLAGTLMYSRGASGDAPQNEIKGISQRALSVTELEEKVIPSSGVELPVVWGDLGQQMVNNGVIDADKFQAIYKQKGTLTDEEKSLLLGAKNGKIIITKDNAGYILNLLWALGLGNKNEILEKGEMMNPAYGGPQNFASTGGWTISKGNPMDHYSRHPFIILTPDQQALVEKVSKGIYRPCCGNSTHFPDCNHGMAMLGLLEIMASQGANEQTMWKTALVVNSYWFPQNYMTIATYMKNKGTDWSNVNPQEILGAEYSSNQGFAKISSQVTTPEVSQSGGGCGVDTGTPAPQPVPQVQTSGCGV